ncbi:MAG: PQQ-like beta-propeller repeat protein [Prevotellaceae bacterium]|jgi:outer membrane protein assembly factor BamB|nr:PQQ-like beta-propeller repeat protein [Prevotellaceae bacterium]
MKKALFRNIAIVSALFAVVLSVMLVTNYFQVRSTTPLQSEVIETLKQLNDQQGGNAELQEQIRQIDLLARRAYFVNVDHLRTGIYLLIGMVLVFVVCARLYVAREKDIPGKVVSPIDEWAIKSRARAYVAWTVGGVTAAALLFALLTSPLLKSSSKPDEAAVPTEQSAEYIEFPDMGLDPGETSPASEEVEAVATTSEHFEEVPATSEQPVATAPTAADTTALTATAPPVSKVTSNAFRGNYGTGISAAKGIPTEWNLQAGTNIAWKQDNPRQGYNSPVINAGRVFFTGADAEARELYCYDLATGEQLWKLAATGIPGSPAQMPETTPDTGLAASTVATNGRQVCAIFATGDILCADTSGKRLWAKNLGVPDNHYGYASSLLIYGTSVIVQYDNQTHPRILALDLATGSERWSVARQEKIAWSSPALARVGDSYQLVITGNPAITALDPADGKQLWRVACLSGEVGASPCSANGIVYGASEYAKLTAINGADGTTLWEASDYLPEVSSPVATATSVYLATSYGVVAVYDAKTGALRKAHELTAEFYSSPVIADGKVYLFSNDGKAFIFAANDDLTLLQTLETGERTFATPAFTDGCMVVRTEKSIYCVRKK